jgi:outer membrane protein OmpA-like peptidoglycan-associated protein
LLISPDDQTPNLDLQRGSSPWCKISSMHDARMRTGIIVVVASLFILATPLEAKADAISIKMVTTVPSGQQPKLTITAMQPVDKVEVLLNRDDGKMVEETIGDLSVGGWRDVMLDGTVGKHKYGGRITCVVDGKPSAIQVDFQTIVSGGVQVTVDKANVDLAKGRMGLLVSIPDGKVELKILSATDGAILVDHEQTFADHATGTLLSIQWQPHAKNTEVGRVDVRVSDPTGAFQSFSMFPWSVYIPHEEVIFATDSAAIAASEAPKLQTSLTKIADALAKHKDLGPIKLYIAGHTDTVGAPKYNQNLSLKRAQAIANWFRKNGLRIPIFCEGFGEQALRIATPDNCDEPRNRRVDYILSVEDPVLRATEFRPTWKAIK